MLPAELIQTLEREHHLTIENSMPVAGGSINSSYKITAEGKHYFLKYNNTKQFPGIISDEVDGLQAIQAKNCIKTPEIIASGTTPQFEYLLLPFLEGGIKSDHFWQLFGEQLAQLHTHSQKTFGWKHNNYIGSLPQDNTEEASYINFFMYRRLMPQLKMAQKNGLIKKDLLAAFDGLFKKLPEILPDEPPALVHGDLWGGNYVCAEPEVPVLIDPSIHFNNREAELAFTHLFGGFYEPFYQAYENTWPLDPGFQERIPIYNLYPLLVHVNLFGAGYLSGIVQTVKQFT